MTKNEQDFYVMGMVRALIDPHERGEKRQRKRSTYSHMGKRVCLFAFLYLENITVYHLKKLRMHVRVHGVVSIEHGNSHKTPHNAFPLDIYQRADNFLRRYLNIDKTSSSKSVTLTQPLSKVYQEYKECDKNSPQTMGYTTFRVFFRKRFPNVKLSIQPPKTAAASLTAATPIATTSHQQHFTIEKIESKNESNTNDLIYYDDDEEEMVPGESIEEEVLEDVEYEQVELEIIGTS